MNILVYTSSKQGNLVNLQCSDGRSLQSNDWQELSGFLLMPCDYALVWNVDRLFGDITSGLSKKQVESLTNKRTGVIFEGRKVYFQSSRTLGINQIDIYSLNRYADKEPDNIQDLLKLAYDVIEAYKALGIMPETLSSPVAAFSKQLEQINYPRVCDLPESAWGLIEQTSKNAWTEWRELYRIGAWQAGEVSDFDVRSCYPALMAHLPDISNAKYFESNNMPDSDEYSWGEMIGELTLKADVTPFGYVGKKDDISITTDQLWLIDKYSWGDFKLKHGYFLKLPRYYRTPFKDIMERLYQTRQNDSPIIAGISKAVANGIGGKLVLRYDSGDLSDTYNCVYGRMLTTRASTKVADKIWRMGLQSSVISVLVDGFLAETKGLKFNIEDKRMGSWKVNSDSAFIVASLMYEWDSKNTKHPNGQYYQDIMENIKKNPRSSIIGDDVDLCLLQHNKEFTELPKTGGELLSKRYNSKSLVKS
jgi:hypothetical protein